LSGDDLTDAYYFAVLYHLGCTASANRHVQVAAGDDVSSRRWISEADYTDHGDLLPVAATRFDTAQLVGGRARIGPS